MQLAKRLPLVLVTITAAVLLAGCEASFSTGSNQVNTEDASDSISSLYTERTGLDLTEIDCDGTEAEVDNEFGCKAENEVGLTLDIEGTITEVNDDGDKVKFGFTITKAVSDGSVFAESALSTLQEKGTPISAIDCPEFEVTEGSKVECEATTDDGSTQTAIITLTDDDGGFDVRLTN